MQMRMPKANAHFFNQLADLAALIFVEYSQLLE